MLKLKAMFIARNLKNNNASHNNEKIIVYNAKGTINTCTVPNSEAVSNMKIPVIKIAEQKQWNVMYLLGVVKKLMIFFIFLQSLEFFH